MGRGIDTELFHPARRSRTDSDLVLAFVGRLMPEKNLRLLPQVAAALRYAGVERFRFQITGAGGERAWLERNLPNAMFTGVLSGEALARAYADADIFLFPSRTDTFGNVVQEALASGVPAIVMNEGGPRFIVRHGVTGMVASSDEEFCQSAVTLASNERVRREMGRAGRASGGVPVLGPRLRGGLRGICQPRRSPLTAWLRWRDTCFAHPWEVFVRRWNWKAALLSALFRGVAFALPMTSLVGDDAVRSLCIEMGFRVAIGGFWGSLLQAFRGARPVWLANLSVAVALPVAAHCLEFAALVRRSRDAYQDRHAGVGGDQRRVAAHQPGTHAQGTAGHRRRGRVAARRSAADSRGAGPHVPAGFREATDMKTLHLTNCWHAESGGIATFYRELLRQAENQQRPIRLVVPDARDGVETYGNYGRIYRVRGCPAPFSPGYRAMMPLSYLHPRGRVRQILAEERPDLVECCDKYTLNFLAGLLRFGWLGIPRYRPAVVGLTCERMDENVAQYVSPGRMARAFCRWYMQWLYFPLFDHHIANSPHTAGELRQARSAIGNGAACGCAPWAPIAACSRPRAAPRAFASGWSCAAERPRPRPCCSTPEGWRRRKTSIF